MSYSEPILSICIPTFERADDLKRCLNSIFQIEKEILSKIQVCVSDNNSSYDFLMLMQSYSLHDNLRYKKNSSNVGFDCNILSVIGMASAKYVMLLGNDDVLTKNGVANLLKILNKDAPDAVFMNYKITLNRQKKSYLAYNILKYRSKLSLNWILLHLKEKTTFISSIVLKRSILNNESDNISKFIGFQFIHFVIIFETLKTTKNISYIPDAVVTAFDDNSDNYDVKNYFLEKLGEIVNFYRSFYDLRSIDSLKYGILRHVVLSGQKIVIQDLIAFKFVTLKSIFIFLLYKFNILRFAIYLKNKLKNRLLM